MINPTTHPHPPRPEKTYDLAVCGGGPAGFAAAVSAARLGANVLLTEASSALGGMATMGLVTTYDPMTDGRGNIAAGIMKEMLERLYERGWLPDHVHPQNWNELYLCPTHINPELVKVIKDEMAAEAGVEVRFMTRAVAVEAEPEKGRLKRVQIADIEGLQWVSAQTFVDATGDAAVAALAGVEHRLATRDTPAPMPATLCFIVSNVDDARKENPKKYAGQALADGHFTQPEVRLVPSRLAPGTYGFNAGHIFQKNFAAARDYSESLRFGRKMAVEHVEFLRKYVPGFEHCILVSTSPLLGVRESRRIVGEYELTWGDFADALHFPDQIGVYAKEVDIHCHSLDPRAQEASARLRHMRFGWLPRGASYGIPYGVLVPRGWKNLWVAGRAASFDEIVFSSARVMPACMMMGEAAGAAAVQSLKTGQPADALDTATLVRTLRGQGAFLPQKTLCPEMTRGRGAPEPSNPVCPVVPLSDINDPDRLPAIPKPERKEAEPKPGSPSPASAQKSGDEPESDAAFIRRAADEIDRNCCRSTFHDADTFCARLIREAKRVEADPERATGLLQEVATALRDCCCKSGLTQACELADNAERRAKDTCGKIRETPAKTV